MRIDLQKSKRQSLALFFMLACATMTTFHAHAQQGAWKPNKTVEFIIGATSGGAQDRIARLMQIIVQDLKLVPTPVTVVNKPGASGTVSLTYLAQHLGDGHYLTFTSLSILTNPIVGRSSMAPTEFTPVAVMGSEYIGIFVLADSPLKTGKDLVEVLHKKPDALSATIGLGPATTLHISYLRAMKASGVDIKKLKTIGFNSGSQATTALLGGHIDVTVATPSVMLPHMRSGRVRMIAIGAPERQAGELSQVPTWRELGVQGTYEIWRGIAGPKGMSQQQLHYWDDVLGKVVKSQSWKKDIESSYMINSYKDSKATAAYWKQEYEDAKEVLTEVGFVK